MIRKILLSCLMLASVLMFGDGTVGAMTLSVNEARVITLPSMADTVFVAEPKVATYQAVTNDKMLIFGRSPGVTSFLAFDANGNTLYSDKITVSFDTSIMHAALKREFPSLNLKLTAMSDGVVVSGEVPSAQVAADVIALLDSFVATAVGTVANQNADTGSESDTDSPTEMPDEELTGPGTGRGTMAARMGKVINRLTVTMPTQVMIRVRVAEVSRDVSEKLGFNWFWSRQTNWFGRSFQFGLSDTAVTSSAAHGFFSDLVPDISVMIDALAEENLVSILAEPNLSVTSGETASFLAGGKVPFPEVGDSGNMGTTLYDYGVMLTVTPTVLSENRISLRVRPEVSDVSYANAMQYNGMVVPSIITRSTETTIEMASGQSFVIGGLLQSNINNAVNKFPVLGDVPVMGALFRSSEFARGETELVIIATAYIGQPSGGQLRIPNANIVIPNMFNRLFLGMQPQVSSGTLRPEDLVYY